jgi:hypothetical protein
VDQFESFPQFMDGVERVEQKDDTRLHWVAEIGATSANGMLRSLSSIGTIAWHGKRSIRRGRTAL